VVMKQTTDTGVIDNLRSRLLFGNDFTFGDDKTDPLIAIASMRTTPDTYVFIFNSEIDKFDPELMELAIGEIHSDEQFKLAIRECEWVVDKDKARLYYLFGLISDYLEDSEIEVLND
jgi:hypothetical protein